MKAGWMHPAEHTREGLMTLTRLALGLKPKASSSFQRLSEAHMETPGPFLRDRTVISTSYFNARANQKAKTRYLLGWALRNSVILGAHFQLSRFYYSALRGIREIWLFKVFAARL